MRLISANGKRYFWWNLPPLIPWILLLFASTVNRLVFPCKWWATKMCLRLNSIFNKTHPSRSYKQYSRVNRKKCKPHLRHSTLFVVLFMVILSFIQMSGIYNVLPNVAPGERERDQGILCKKKILRKVLRDFSNVFWQLYNTILVYSLCLTIYKSV